MPLWTVILSYPASEAEEKAQQLGRDPSVRGIELIDSGSSEEEERALVSVLVSVPEEGEVKKAIFDAGLRQEVGNGRVESIEAGSPGADWPG
jgi:hypothetical protein